MSTSRAAEKSLYAIFYFLPLFRQLQIDLNPSIRFQTRRNFKLSRRFPDGDRASRMIFNLSGPRPDVWKEHKSTGLPRSRRPIAAMAKDFAAGSRIARHHHQRAQLVYSASGATRV